MIKYIMLLISVFSLGSMIAYACLSPANCFYLEIEIDIAYNAGNYIKAEMLLNLYDNGGCMDVSVCEY